MKSLMVKVVLSIILIFLLTYAWVQQYQTESRDSEFYFNRGLAYEKKGQYDQAISDFTKALEINPRYAEAYKNRQIAYEKKCQHDRAISDDTKAPRGEYPKAKSNIHIGITHYIVVAVAVLISFFFIKKLLKSKKQAECLQKHFPAEESYKKKTSNKRRTLLELISVFSMVGVGVGGIFLSYKFIDIYYPEFNIPHYASVIEVIIAILLVMGILCIGMPIGYVVSVFVLRPFFTEEEFSESKRNVSTLINVFSIPLPFLIPFAFFIIVLNVRSIPVVIRIIIALSGSLLLLKILLKLGFGERNRLLKCKTCGSPLVDGPYVERHGGNDHFKCTVKGIPTKVCPNGCPGVYRYQRDFSDEVVDAIYEDSQNVAQERLGWSKNREFCRRCDAALTDKGGRAQFVFHHNLEKGTDIEVTIEAPCLECTRCGSKYLPPEPVEGDDELANVIGGVVDQELICE